MSNPQKFRRATRTDIDRRLSAQDDQPTLYVCWDGPLSFPEKFSYEMAHVFPSGRILFVLDDTGGQLLVDQDGNSVLGTAEMVVEVERLFAVIGFCRIFEGLAGVLSAAVAERHPRVFTSKEEADAACTRMYLQDPKSVFQVVEIFNHETLPRE